MWVDPATVARTDVAAGDHSAVAAFVREVAGTAPVSVLVDARCPALRDDAVATYRVAHGSGLVRARPVAVLAPEARTLLDALDLLLRPDDRAVVLSGVAHGDRWALAGAVVGPDPGAGETVDDDGTHTWFLRSTVSATPAADQP